MMTTFFSSKVRKGWRWIFSKLISPSSLSATAPAALRAMKVWTCGICNVSATAKRKTQIETIVSQNILSPFLIVNIFYMVQLAKLIKISEKIRIFAV